MCIADWRRPAPWAGAQTRRPGYPGPLGGADRRPRHTLARQGHTETSYAVTARCRPTGRTWTLSPALWIQLVLLTSLRVRTDLAPTATAATCRPRSSASGVTAAQSTELPSGAAKVKSGRLWRRTVAVAALRCRIRRPPSGWRASRQVLAGRWVSSSARADAAGHRPPGRASNQARSRQMESLDQTAARSRPRGR